MSEQPDNLQKQLKQFGLSEDAVTVYLQLIKDSSLTALQLSRKLKLARTKVYRILEKLTEKGLAAEEIQGYGKNFVATSPRKLLEIMHEKEREILLLKATTPTIVQQLHALQNVTSSKSKILHYRGEEGLKQVTWNSTKACGVFRIYELGESMETFLDHEFAEKVRAEYAKHPDTQFRQLTNHKKLTDYSVHKKHIEAWTPRFIDPKILSIGMELVIYNDVYVAYEYTSNDVFIVEVYNQELADTNKQIFDLIWEQALPMKKTDDNGTAILEE